MDLDLTGEKSSAWSLQAKDNAYLFICLGIIMPDQSFGISLYQYNDAIQRMYKALKTLFKKEYTFILWMFMFF